MYEGIVKNKFGKANIMDPTRALDNYNGAKPSVDLLKQANVYSFLMICFQVITEKYPFDGALTPKGPQGPKRIFDVF